MWDRVVGGWVGPRHLDEVDALRCAAGLNVTADGRASSRRTVDPPEPVLVVFEGGRVAGVLDAWSRDVGLWWGHVTVGGRDGWYPAFALRWRY